MRKEQDEKVASESNGTFHKMDFFFARTQPMFFPVRVLYFNAHMNSTCHTTHKINYLFRCTQPIYRPPIKIILSDGRCETI